MPLPLVGAVTFGAAWAKIISIVPYLVALGAFQAAAKIFALLGMTFVTYTGFFSVFEIFEQFIVDQFSELPQIMLAILYYAKVDKAITILFSAYLQAMAVRGVNELTRPVFVGAN